MVVRPIKGGFCIQNTGFHYVGITVFVTRIFIFIEYRIDSTEGKGKITFMNIMYATDDNYVEIMAVSIQSVIEHNRDDIISFYLVVDKVSEENIKKLRIMIEITGNEVFFITKPDIRSMVMVELRTLRWSDSAYSRLFLQELFGERPEIEKLLYIDCDTIIVGSLKDLWETDIEEYLGAACLECMSNMHKYIIGRKRSDNYINSGMILFNVKRWVQENVQTKCIHMIQKYKGKTEYVDQGVINGTVSNQLKLVSPRYNLTTLAFDFSYEDMQIYRKPQFGYSKNEWKEAINNPIIVHFTTSFLSLRPWFEGSNHPYAEYWKQVHDRTPWKGRPYRELRNRKKWSRSEKLYRRIPARVGIYIVGFLHSYVKPIIYVLRK